MDSEIADAAVPRWKVSNEGVGGKMMRDIAANNYGENYCGVRARWKPGNESFLVKTADLFVALVLYACILFDALQCEHFLTLIATINL